MAKNKGLHISKVDLFANIEAFTGLVNTEVIKSEKCLNQVNNQCRYEIIKNEVTFNIDVYYKKDKTINPTAAGSGKEGQLSKELVEFIISNSAFKNVASGNFTCDLSEEAFNLLKEYLDDLQGVSIEKDENKGANGHVLQYVSEIGDKITLTYYTTTHNLRFQGYLMKLHVEVKCFLNAYTYVRTEVQTIQANKIATNETKILNVINTELRNSYDKLDPLLQDLLYDAITQIVIRPSARDYSVWTFPALKALEGRIKQMFSFEGIRINDKIGFAVKDIRTNTKRPMFNFVGAKHVINTSIVSISDGNTLSELSDCYTYWNKNRNELFHAKQVLGMTRQIGTPEEAENIIYEVCKLVEKSYIKVGR